ncbi:MAG TPA: bacillithiol biosynthesis deacetylase BshB1 [Candidatus Eisenbacteria bacterium]|nr:bacillithiol biosynthesis deacetylase BshB1 [Candidatus Eisenbacteria bacterium]
MTDVLAVGAHPDDAELAFGATLARLAAQGTRVVILDLTAGERASRGEPATRAQEAAEAARVLGVTREGLGLPDLGLRKGSHEQIRAVVEALRRHRPALVLAPHPEEGHPDHAHASALVERACYEARLAKADGAGARHVVEQLLFAWPGAGAVQGAGAGGGGALGGGFVIDVSESFAAKRAALACYRSQFDARGGGVETRLSDPGFLDLVEARARVAGAVVEARYGEGFTYRGALRLTPALAGWLGNAALDPGR